MKIKNTLFIKLSIFLCVFISSMNTYAEGVMIEHANGRFRNSFYLIDANITYELSESVLEALSHGIQLRFDVTFEVKRERNWMWDKNVGTAILSYSLEYLPLSNNYLVTNLVKSERRQVVNLDEALKILGSINDFPVINENELDPDRSYNVFMMSSLKIRNLPLPLQPLAFVSPKWKLSSPWYEWTIR